MVEKKAAARRGAARATGATGSIRVSGRAARGGSRCQAHLAEHRLT
jgi:hypothetical protein